MRRKTSNSGSEKRFRGDMELASASMPAGVFDLVMLPCCRSPRSIYRRSVDLHVKQPRTKEDSESEIEAAEQYDFISNPQKKEEFATESEQAVSE
jgi:hypothetical protein